jgi:hypothetical protein
LSFFHIFPEGNRVRVITRQEQLFLDDLKKDGILDTLDPKRLKPSIAFFCGDCDRSPEALDYRKRMLQAIGTDCKLHHIALNGGPLNLVHEHFSDLDPQGLGDPYLIAMVRPLADQLSATNRKALRGTLNEVIRTFLYQQIRGSEELKKLGKLELLPHWPCGQGEVWKYDIEMAFHKAALATQDARERIATWPEAGNIRTASAMHTHKDTGMKTYHYRAIRWLDSRRAAQLA